jgi:hypothetical protein
MEKGKTLEEQYPAVDLVYDIAKESYSVAMTRIDEANASFDRLRSWITTLTLAFMAWIIPRVQISSIDYHFFAGVAIFIVIIILTMYGKASNGVQMPAPKKLYEHRLHQDRWTFKKDFIFLAAQDFEKNKSFVNAKANLTICIFILFLEEAAVFVSWFLSARPKFG